MEKNKAAIVAGILNLISGILCFAFIVLTVFTIQHQTEDSGEAVVLIFLVLFFIPRALVLLPVPTRRPLP